MEATKKFLIGAALAAALAAAVLAEPAGALKPSGLPHVQQLAITITGQASDERVSPSMGNIAVAAGVQVRITVTNYTREYHTFTIPGLNVSALILPARGQKARKTTFTFTAHRPGTFAWHCAYCAKGVHGVRHPMGGAVYAIIDPMVLP
jgi:heme/copper-type cytochrome/quinol oxidase subunit 2